MLLLAVGIGSVGIAVAAAVGVVTFIVAVVDVAGIVAGWKLFGQSLARNKIFKLGKKLFCSENYLFSQL